MFALADITRETFLPRYRCKHGHEAMRLALAVDGTGIAYHACVKATFGQSEGRLLRGAGKLGIERRTIAFERHAAVSLDETVGDHDWARGTREGFTESFDGLRIFGCQLVDPRKVEAECRVDHAIGRGRALRVPE